MVYRTTSPFLSICRGRNHSTLKLVELCVVTVRLTGGPVGAAHDLGKGAQVLCQVTIRIHAGKQLLAHLDAAEHMQWQGDGLRATLCKLRLGCIKFTTSDLPASAVSPLSTALQSLASSSPVESTTTMVRISTE